MLFIFCSGLVLGSLFGALMLLVFQGGEATGRLVQHANDLMQAWHAADALKVDLALLKTKHEVECTGLRAKHEAEVLEMQNEFETRYSNMARAYDREVHKNHTVESRRVEAWKTAHTVLRELHADPAPKCEGCGDSIGQVMLTKCFSCDVEAQIEAMPREAPSTIRPRAQA